MSAARQNGALTPMLRQYHRIKDKHPDAILLFRLGDFYEMFYEDAEIASKILDITLTSRNKNDPNPVPLCGVPYHSVEPYIARLLKSGRKVAICEQMEDPRQVKGMVKREVTRVITPGVVADGLGLEAQSHNFLACAAQHKDHIGLALADISTGLLQAGELDSPELLMEELMRAEPREILLPPELTADELFVGRLKGEMPTVVITPIEHMALATASLEENLEGGARLVSGSPAAAQAAAGALHYLRDTQKGRIGHITAVRPLAEGAVMRLDESTKRNLELVRNMLDGGREGSLLEVMDRTATAAGARKLKRWLLYPLVDSPRIVARHNAVEGIIEDGRQLRELPPILGRIYDIERIIGRVFAGTANARDLMALKGSLEAASEISTALAARPAEDRPTMLADLAGRIDGCPDLIHIIDQHLVDDPPHSVREGGMIRPGFSAELDEMRDLIAHGKDYIARIEATERRATGIGSLKVRYNKVFGYYLEVTHVHRDKVPDHYIRKQTLVNAERYITPELKEYEEKVLGAQERSRALEYELFAQLRDTVSESASRLLGTADALAALDALVSFALVAVENNYSKPEVHDGPVIDIRDGRHPVVERYQLSERFVPNDVVLDDGQNMLLMITGPNMAGKSTVMRQTALIVLMAQMGSFVPASTARIGMVDRIFTRVGASDILSRGQSTFMVEMAEASVILKEATPRSLVVIDEIGRGTSTFDGLAIAWAVAEDLHDRVQARTMFATHYHELTELAVTKPGIKNMNIAVREWNNEVVFLRRLVQGATSRSYGIQVARLAGLPGAVVKRATQVLSNLEEDEFDEMGQPRVGESRHQVAGQEGVLGEGPSCGQAQYQLFHKPLPSEIAERLSQIDTSTLTPIEALNILHELKSKL
jgi:DNA mismatch repair protein MutS